MSEVMCALLWFGENAFLTTFPSVRLLILWAAQSALISSAGIPHTFSVYVLKNFR